VNDTAETITAQNMNSTGCADTITTGRLGSGGASDSARCGPMSVVVIDGHRQNPLEVLLVQNQERVETFRAGRAHEPLGKPRPFNSPTIRG
jgi:hypothetical protein